MSDQLELVDPEGRSLSELAQIANTEHKLAFEARDEAVMHALRCGAALNAARARVEHGEWLPWLEANFDGSQPTAWRFMQIATNYSRVNNLDASSQAAVLRALGPPRMRKRDVGGGVSHPARYSDVIITKIADLLPRDDYPLVLDPFAGTGRIHELDQGTVGIELEPEWAALDDRTICGDIFTVLDELALFDAVATSPTFGNRYADHHDARDPESRRSYTHDLGRPLTAGNSGVMQWGAEYRAFHRRAWQATVVHLRPGGKFLLNIKDHYRNGQRQGVHFWHVAALRDCGLEYVRAYEVVARDMRAGENSDARCEEWIIELERP